MKIGDRVKIIGGSNAPGDHNHKNGSGVIVYDHTDEKEFPWDFTVSVDGFNANGFDGVPFSAHELEVINDTV